MRPKQLTYRGLKLSYYDTNLLGEMVLKTEKGEVLQRLYPEYYKHGQCFDFFDALRLLFMTKDFPCIPFINKAVSVKFGVPTTKMNQIQDRSSFHNELSTKFSVPDELYLHRFQFLGKWENEFLACIQLAKEEQEVDPQQEAISKQVNPKFRSPIETASKDALMNEFMHELKGSFMEYKKSEAQKQRLVLAPNYLDRLSKMKTDIGNEIQKTWKQIQTLHSHGQRAAYCGAVLTRSLTPFTLLSALAQSHQSNILLFKFASFEMFGLKSLLVFHFNTSFYQ